jgi:8-oxo-dGTP pyrophosphatase MutT (NUDIX family)
MSELMLVKRDAIRAIIVTPENEVLLLRIHSDHKERFWWVTPGGGRKPEAVEDALKRELQEELSLNEYARSPAMATTAYIQLGGQTHSPK